VFVRLHWLTENRASVGQRPLMNLEAEWASDRLSHMHVCLTSARTIHHVWCILFTKRPCSQLVSHAAYLIFALISFMCPSILASISACRLSISVSRLSICFSVCFCSVRTSASCVRISRKAAMTSGTLES